jgi:hypothetical protein
VQHSQFGVGRDADRNKAGEGCDIDGQSTGKECQGPSDHRKEDAPIGENAAIAVEAFIVHDRRIDIECAPQEVLEHAVEGQDEAFPRPPKVKVAIRQPECVGKDGERKQASSDKAFPRRLVHGMDNGKKTK